MKPDSILAPVSIVRTKWDKIDYLIPDQFQKDFCHNHALTVNLQFMTKQHGFLKFVRKMTTTSYTDKIKVWKQLKKVDTYLYVHYLEDKIRIHYDHGVRYINWHPINFYGSLDFRKNGKDPSVRFGVNYLGQYFSVNNKIKLDTKYNSTFYTQIIGQLSQFRIILQSAIDLRTQKFLKKDLFCSYDVGKFTFNFKYIQDWSQCSGFQRLSRIFNRVITTTLYKSQGILTGFQVQVWRKNDRLHKLISAILDMALDQKSRIKMKIDDSISYTFMYQTLALENMKVQIGSRIPFTGNQKFQIGLKVSLNI